MPPIDSYTIIFCGLSNSSADAVGTAGWGFHEKQGLTRTGGTTSQTLGTLIVDPSFKLWDSDAQSDWGLRTQEPWLQALCSYSAPSLTTPVLCLAGGLLGCTEEGAGGGAVIADRGVRRGAGAAPPEGLQVWACTLAAAAYSNVTTGFTLAGASYMLMLMLTPAAPRCLAHDHKWLSWRRQMTW